jgi:peptide methionine sulfoxide reductase MsrB
MYDLPIGLALLGHVFESPQDQRITFRCIDSNVLQLRARRDQIGS